MNGTLHCGIPRIPAPRHTVKLSAKRQIAIQQVLTANSLPELHLAATDSLLDELAYKSASGSRVFARLGGEWDFWSLEIEHLLDAGDNVVALGRYKARHSETGKDLDAQFAHIWWLANGKITRFQQYADTAQAISATKPS